MFSHVLVILGAALLLVACRSPCTELDALCDGCPPFTQENCRYQVACLSDQKCDSILEDVGEQCPFAELPSCRAQREPTVQE